MSVLLVCKLGDLKQGSGLSTWMGSCEGILVLWYSGRVIAMSQLKSDTFI